MCAGDSLALRDRTAVLVVDDDQILAELLSLTLVNAGFDTVVAVDAATAQLVLDQRDDISVVVCDVELGGGDGVAFLRTVCRARPATKGVLISGFARSAVPDEIGAGFGFLRKPFAPGDLLHAIDSA